MKLQSGFLYTPSALIYAVIRELLRTSRVSSTDAVIRQCMAAITVSNASE